MTVTFAESIVIEFYNGSAWVDISAYVVGNIRGSMGLGGWRPENRVAAIGSLNLVLNNKAKLFSPMGGDALKSLNTLSGWQQGARIRITITYEFLPHVIWMGQILSIDSDDKNWGSEQVRVVAVDYMHILANFPMKRATIATSKTQDQALDLILARLSVQPDSTNFDAGKNVFATVFDGVKNRTMAISELNRLALSELGYIYMQGDGTLRAENSDARVGSRALDTIPVAMDQAGFILKEDGSYLLLEDGGRLLHDEVGLPDLDTTAESFNIFSDPNAVLNSVMVRAYPVITDTSLKVLYSLGVPMYIPARGTIAFSAHYTDPNGLGQCSGTNMQAPAATTDYLANDQADGGGASRTADLTVTATYYGDTVEYSMTLGADTGAWITKLQARGYGIYYGNSIESQIEDVSSQAAYGYGAAQIDQRYQRNIALSTLAAGAIIEEYKRPKSRITRMNYLANLNGVHLMSFLHLAIGSLMSLTEDRSAITRHYYITDIAFTIRQGGIIQVTYGLKQNDTYLSGGLAPIAFEGRGGDNPDGIDFGYLPKLDNLQEFSVAFWLWCDAESVPFHENVILAHMTTGTAGWFIYETSTRKIQLQIWYSAIRAMFDTPNNSINFGEWMHCVLTREPGTTPGRVKAYINGAPVTVTQSSPSGTQTDDAGARLILGNLVDTGEQWLKNFNGKLFDIRIYDRVLTAAEAAEIYNAGVPAPGLSPSGLIFQAPGVNSDLGDATSLAGTTLLTTDRVLDNAFRIVGTPHGAPVIRAAP